MPRPVARRDCSGELARLLNRKTPPRGRGSSACDSLQQGEAYIRALVVSDANRGVAGMFWMRFGAFGLGLMPWS